MAIKSISESLCKERSGNILEKISDVDKKLDKWMTNHAVHMQDDMKEIREEINAINKKILFIMNKFENDELIRSEKQKERQNKIDWAKYITPILTGATFSILNILLKYWGVI
jgi:Tfp pilus assembly major pilin PilA